MSITDEIMKEYNLKDFECEKAILDQLDDEIDKEDAKKNELIKRLEELIYGLENNNIDPDDLKLNISFKTEAGIKHSIKFRGDHRGILR